MDPLDAHSCYGESKRMAETMCKAFYTQYHVPAKIARIAHTYAPTMDVEHDPRVFASFVKDIAAGRDIVMKSNGTGRRSFCYITDAVAGYFLVLFKGAAGEAYNICNTSQYISIRALADKLVQMYPERNLRVIQQKRGQEEHYMENKLLIGCESTLDNRKLRDLGWEAKVTIENGFNRVIKYIEALQQ